MKAHAALVRQYLSITAACILHALAFCWFYQPNAFTIGGITGTAQIIHFYAPSLLIGVMTLIMNIPLFLLGHRFYGRSFLLSSLYATVLNSVFIDIINSIYTFSPMEPILAAVYGGIAMGATFGWLLRENSNTGGTELGARILKRYLPGVSIGTICLVVDLIVICAYAAVFGRMENAFYGGMALFLSSRAVDAIVYGGNKAKAAYIISTKHEQIADTILSMHIGATLLPGKGVYTGIDRPVLLCIFHGREIVAVKRVVKETDPDAFLILSDVREVLGNGFGEYRPDAL